MTGRAIPSGPACCQCFGRVFEALELFVRVQITNKEECPMKQTWMTVMAVAVLGVGLSLQLAVSLAGKEDEHTQEVIKHAKEGVAHTKEAIHHIEESVKGTGDAHAKEALQHAKEAIVHAEESIAHAEMGVKKPEGKKSK